MPKANSVNKAILVGNVGQDPEVKYTASGVPVAKLSVATNERFKDKNGQWKTGKKESQKPRAKNLRRGQRRQKLRTRFRSTLCGSAQWRGFHRSEIRAKEPPMKLSVFVGTSLDGFIARRNGRYDFLPAGGGEPHGYDEFIASVDTILIGRNTFEVVLKLPRWPYSDKRVVVLSHRPLDFSGVTGR